MLATRKGRLKFERIYFILCHSFVPMFFVVHVVYSYLFPGWSIDKISSGMEVSTNVRLLGSPGLNESDQPLMMLSATLKQCERGKHWPIVLFS